MQKQGVGIYSQETVFEFRDRVKHWLRKNEGFPREIVLVEAAILSVFQKEYQCGLSSGDVEQFVYYVYGMVLPLKRVEELSREVIEELELMPFRWDARAELGRFRCDEFKGTELVTSVIQEVKQGLLEES